MNRVNLYLKHFKTLHKLLIQDSRNLATHWDPKFRSLRRKKFIKFDLPDFDKIRKEANATIEEQRSFAIKNGVEPTVTFEYKPFNITSSGELFDPYVPPEGDGKATIITREGLNQVYTKLKSKGTYWRHARKIQQYDESFEAMIFADEAQRIFIEAHQALANRDSEKLIDLVTESCYPKMWGNNLYKTIRWKWIEAIEPPQLVHCVTRELLSKSNIYAQVTIRLHSKQTLAIYDRFGRLAFGDENLEKNVLEYCVFEKHLTNQYGIWRLHDKITPKWSEPKLPPINTYRKPKMYKMHQDVGENESKFKKDESHLKDVEASKSSNDELKSKTM